MGELGGDFFAVFRVGVGGAMSVFSLTLLGSGLSYGRMLVGGGRGGA